ncbi:AraC family transcriptional regulator [Nocardia sp. NPDC051832]|uniref:AraC family transcriptional regulator n=1 Tax=Nocardia sp. NPDC051832 TaxID=3155673 RepID=UPI0034313E90
MSPEPAGRTDTACRVGARTLWLWPGQAAYLGPSFQLDTHSTPVQCFVLGVDEPVTIRTPDGGHWQRRSALVPARTAHKLETSGRVLFYYLDPRSAAATHLRAAMREPATPIAAAHREEATLIAHLRSGAPDPRELRRIIAGADTPAVIDERIGAVLDAIAADPASPRGAADFAVDLGISSSRFLHLFSAGAGTSFRRYRLWARLLAVGTAVGAGADLTRAAADAGFASASHFSDTFRTLFGLTASEVLGQGIDIVIVPALARA